MSLDFLKHPLKFIKSGLNPKGVSRLRKWLIWILMIGFWLLYYWVKPPSGP
ncbi:MAG: hypothetical protein ACE5ER_09935 [Nitrospinaceae bacterium]